MHPSGANSVLDPLTPQELPLSAGPPSRAGVPTLARSSPFQSRAAGRLSVCPSAPNSVHTRRLPAPAGSSSRAGQEVWPPPTNRPTRSLLRPAGVTQVEVLTLGQLLRPIPCSALHTHTHRDTPKHTGFPTGEPQRPAPSRLPFRALGSAKSETRSVPSGRDVTAFPRRRRRERQRRLGWMGWRGLGVAFSGAEDL